MSTKQTTKIRLVKCPKCNRLLPEMEDLPVYKCGGCETILQAKPRRNNLENTTLNLPETDIVHSSELEVVFEDSKGSSSTSQFVNLISDEKEGSLIGKDQLEVLDVAKEGFSSTHELTYHENLGSPAVSVRNSDLVVATANNPVAESTLSPAHEQLDHVMSTNTSHTTGIIDPSSDLCGQETLKRGKFPAKGITGRNVGMQDQAKNSFLTEKNELTRFDDVESARLPFYPPQLVFESGSPSNHWHDEFQRNSSFYSPDNPRYPEQEKIKLLRMVYELQNQLGRTRVDRAHHAIPNVPIKAGKHNATFYSHELGYLGHPRMCRQVDNSYFHCYPSDCQCSVEFPLPIHSCNQGPCWNHLGHNSNFTHVFRPSTHFSHMDREVTRDDYHQRHKHHVVKRHYRAIAGGAPFVTCYNCLKPLQLPADFLILKKRCHQIKCGACSKVLKFSVQSNNHIIPNTMNMRNKMKQSMNRDKIPVSNCEEAGPSSNYMAKESSEIEEVEPKRSSPLHRLMGHTSTTEVIEGSEYM